MSYGLNISLYEPYLEPVFTQSAELFGLPHIAVKMGFLLTPLLALTILGFMLRRLVVQASQLKMSGAYVIYGFISGVSYVGLQALFLEKITSLGGRTTLSLVVIMNLFLLTCAVACYLIETEKFSRPGHSLRWFLIVMVGSSMVAYAGLDSISATKLSGVEFIWLSSAFLFIPAVCAGGAFGLFFQMLSGRGWKLIPVTLLSVSLGSLVAGLETKAVALELGFSMAFSLMLLCHVGMALLIPAESSPDRSESA